MPDLSSRFADLNPFASAGSGSDSDSDSDTGEPAAVDDGVSPAMQHFLVEQGVVAEADAGVDADEPGPGVRAHLVDGGHPLPAYFVSASHNMYLPAH